MTLLISTLVLADGWDMDMHDWSGGWWVVMALGMVLFWALVIVGVVWLVRSGFGDRAAVSAPSPRDILDERLASGDISVEEYQQKRSALSGGRTNS